MRLEYCVTNTAQQDAIPAYSLQCTAVSRVISVNEGKCGDVLEPMYTVRHGVSEGEGGQSFSTCLHAKYKIILTNSYGISYSLFLSRVYVCVSPCQPHASKGTLIHCTKLKAIGAFFRHLLSSDSFRHVCIRWVLPYNIYVHCL